MIDKSDIGPSLDIEVYQQTIEVFSLFMGLVLLSFAKHGVGLRNKIARNFCSRGMRCLQSIFTVWKAGCEQDAWILHRSLLDRLFHIHHLGETNEFLDFEEYSFISMYKARQRLLSDPDMNAKIPVGMKDLQEKERPRYYEICQKQCQWRRPKAEEIAKKMDLGFLYRFGYDYASTHVHPMINDGEADFRSLISPPNTIPLPDATVVSNSILVQSMLVQEAFNISELRWRAIAYNFLEQVRASLRNGDRQYQLTFYKIGKAWPEFELCEAMA